MSPALIVGGPSTETYSGALHARYDFRSPIRDWSLLVCGSPPVLQFGAKPVNPVFLMLTGSQVAWGSLATLSLYYPYMEDVAQTDWSRISDHVSIWNPIL